MASISKARARDARKRLTKNVQVLVLSAMAVAGFVLGYIGYFLAYASTPEGQSPWMLLYFSFKLFLFDFRAAPAIPVVLEIARYLCGAVTGYSGYKAIAMVFIFVFL